MSKVKKILAVVLSMAMILGMSVTAFAAENTNVNVSVTGIGFDRTADTATVKYLQIVEPNTGSTDGYSIIDAYTSYFGKTSVADLITIAKGETPNANATAGTLNSNSDLAAILQSIATNEANNMTDAANASFNATSGGLYLITASRTGYSYSPMLVYVPVNSQEAIIVTAKGSYDETQKTVAEDGQSIAKGDIVDYTIDSQYPYYSAQYPEENVIYTIKDTLTRATHNPDSLEVYINDVLATVGTDYTVTYNDDNNEFVITFNYSRAKAGAAVRVEYNVTVGDVAVGSSLINIAEKNTASDEGEPITRTRSTVTSNPVAFTFAKIDAETLDALGGATFALYEKVEGADDKLIAENVTGTENGIFQFDGLDAQKSYYVVETDAPDGYSLNDTKYDLTRATANDQVIENGPTTVTDGDGVEATVYSTEYVYTDNFHVTPGNDYDVDTIPNTTLSSLPSTGGIGTTIFTIGGCAIMIGAAFLFFRSRKKAQQ